MSEESAASDCSWVAIELHDGLMQWVFSAKMQLESLENDVEIRERLQLLEKVRSAKETLGAALKEGRGLIGFLEESTDYSGTWFDQLVHFIGLLQADAERNGQEICFDGNPLHWPNLQGMAAWNTLRIVQQAIANAVRHAGPCSISVRSEIVRGGFSILVSDDGVGFDTSARPANHFGLASMEHRAKLVGGRLEVNSVIGQGSRIQFTLERQPS